MSQSELNRDDYVHDMFAANLSRNERVVLTACLAMANGQGFFKINVVTLAFLAGFRRQYVPPAIEGLLQKGWIYELNQQGDAKTCLGELPEDEAGLTPDPKPVETDKVIDKDLGNAPSVQDHIAHVRTHTRLPRALPYRDRGLSGPSGPESAPPKQARNPKGES